MRRARLVLAAGVLAVAVVVILGGMGWGPLATDPPQAPTYVDPFDVDAPTTGSGLDYGTDAQREAALACVAQANGVAIPALDICTHWEDTGVRSNGLLDLRAGDPGTVRYQDGARPGDDQGTTLIAGHVTIATGDGMGDLFRLADAKPLMAIYATGPDGQPLLYAVTSLTSQIKQPLAAYLFSDQGMPRLALITCGGNLIDKGSYSVHENNIILRATPVPIST